MFARSYSHPDCELSTLVEGAVANTRNARNARNGVPVTSQAQRHRMGGVETNGSSPKNLPQDIQRALQKHDAVLRLSYVEIVSGINRLLRQGIPKEVISQVVTQAVESVSKGFNPLSPEDFYSRTGTQPDD